MKYPYLLLLILFLPFVLAEPVHFAVFGHVYPDYDALDHTVDRLNSMDLDFVVLLGDSLNWPTDERSWSRLDSFVESLDVPVYFVPGNHDIWENGSFEQGYFLSKMSSELFYSFNVYNKTFIVLNTVTGASGEYGISDEQVDFVRRAYSSSDSSPVIFMHNCLFLNYDNHFCNARPFYSPDSAWNSLATEIAPRTAAVFVGDVSTKQPYFSYLENAISYYGVGFSPSELKLDYPRHFLDVTLYENDSLSVIPIAVEDNLVDSEYPSLQPATSFEQIKAYIKKNLALILISLVCCILVLFVALVFLLYLFFTTSRRRPFRRYLFKTSL